MNRPGCKCSLCEHAEECKNMERKVSKKTNQKGQSMYTLQEIAKRWAYRNKH